MNTYETDALIEMASDGTIERYFMAKKVYSGAGCNTSRAVYVDNGAGIEPLDPSQSQAVQLHSREGFNWGYGGSGPQQLAIAILLDFTGDAEIAKRYAMPFKWAHVATWGGNWKITGEEIHAWLIEERLK